MKLKRINRINADGTRTELTTIPATDKPNALVTLQLQRPGYEAEDFEGVAVIIIHDPDRGISTKGVYTTTTETQVARDFWEEQFKWLIFEDESMRPTVHVMYMKIDPVLGSLA